MGTTFLMINLLGACTKYRFIDTFYALNFNISCLANNTEE